MSAIERAFCEGSTMGACARRPLENPSVPERTSKHSRLLPWKRSCSHGWIRSSRPWPLALPLDHKCWYTPRQKGTCCEDRRLRDWLSMRRTSGGCSEALVGVEGKRSTPSLDQCCARCFS